MASIEDSYPLHYHAWYNNFEAIDQLLTSGQGHNIEAVDPRGRTPLHLAITLGHLESVKVLLRHNANADIENSNYWTAVQEAIATGDPELVQVCLQYRDARRNSQRVEGVPGLLRRLTEAPDFYVEMKWEFTSWVPLVSRMCPSDTYKVWKSGSNVRIDTTLLGFNNMSWQRGSRSYIFKGQENVATLMEIDHDSQQVITEQIRVTPEACDMAYLRPSEDAVATRLTSPIVTTYIDTERISFERSKSGVWGWRSDKTENVNGYDCKVFSASNVNLITKSRTEHLTEQDKKQSKKTTRSPLESFLGVVEGEEKVHKAAAAANNAVDHDDVTLLSRNPCHISPEEYFNPDFDLGGRDIGRPIEQSTKTQKFKAQLWLCEDFPLSLPEQVIPIIDLMAASNAHFRKLKDFITLQLPSGFPVKIEIPLFHVLNARITFGNIFASVSDAPGVIPLREDNGKTTCTVDSMVFDPPATYSVRGESHYARLREEEEQLLQFAIQQSLLESGSENEQVTLWEALSRSSTSNALDQTNGSARTPGDGDCTEGGLRRLPPPPSYQSVEEQQLQAILELSKREQLEQERLRQQEDEELQRILELSLLDK